ncbi:PEGA domain-containing protein [Rubrivirga sp.]|uniref:PEGA domain-containing protein n=1 Tax=Rubrivirga sp. TaxID=1885344 RepID=UPI003C77A216
MLPLFLALALPVAGCATLFSGSTDTISFDSDPAGAEVVIDGITQGRTPLTVPVKRPGLSHQSVTLRMDGHDPVTFRLQDGLNRVALLNMFVPIGFIVDAATGSVTKYSRTSYTVDMSRGSVAWDMDSLDRTAEGAVVLPESQRGDVVVSDSATRLTYVFGR